MGSNVLDKSSNLRNESSTMASSGFSFHHYAKYLYIFRMLDQIGLAIRKRNQRASSLTHITHTFGD
jgi:hypothetical protein